MIGLFYFALFVAVAALVKFSAGWLIDTFGPYPFWPLIIGVIVYGAWYEWRARRSTDSADY